MYMTREEILDQLKNDIYCRLKPSKHGGVGVFAIRDIPAGIDPFVGSVKPNYISLSIEQLEDLHPNIKRLVQDFFVYKNAVFHVPDNGLAQVDVPYYINHSDQPNIKVGTDGHTLETTRVIKEGEELTSDYATYNDPEDVFER